MTKKVYFENSKRDKLCGILSVPENADKIVIIAHGFGSNKNRTSFEIFTKMLNQAGIAAFVFDFYGHGESEGKFEDITGTEGADDIIKAFEFVKAKGFKRIVVLGSSFGGFCALIAASKLSEVEFLALRSPVSDFKEVLILKYGQTGWENWQSTGSIMYPVSADGSARKLNYSFAADVSGYDIYDLADSLGIPVYVIHGDADVTVPLAQSQKLKQHIKNMTLDVVAGADHRYTNKDHFNEMAEKLIGFIIKKFKTS